MGLVNGAVKQYCMAALYQNLNSALALAQRVHTKYPSVCSTFAAVNDAMRAHIHDIAERRDRGLPVIPDVSFNAIRRNGFNAQQRAHIQQHGCVIVRGVEQADQVAEWNAQLLDYLAVNRYYDTLAQDIAAGHPGRIKHPNMLDVYWSQPQIAARQSSRVCQLQTHLNRLWNCTNSGAGAFNPSKLISYADKVRVREPFDQSNGLIAHVDSCSLESWFDLSAIEACYQPLLNGQWQQFNAFNAAGRVFTNAKPHSEANSVFRTFQGWMALTEQGANCGTLQLVPSSHCVSWLFLHTLNQLINHDSEMYPVPGEAFCLTKSEHQLLFDGLCSLPTLAPGDSVWWHPDVVHAVEFANNSAVQSSVMFLGVAPDCARNRRYTAEQQVAFERGHSPPDFEPVHAEQHYQGRAQQRHLTETGRALMGITTSERAEVC